MSRLLSAFDRLILLILAGITGAVGVALTAWALRIQPLGGWVADLPKEQLAVADTYSWWPAALVAVVIVGLVGGLWLILINARRSRLGFSELPGSGHGGLLRTTIPHLAEACATDLQRIDGVRAARATCVIDRGQELAHFELVVDPLIDLEAVNAACVATAQDFTGALGDSRVATRFVLKLSPVNRRGNPTA